MLSKTSNDISKFLSRRRNFAEQAEEERLPKRLNDLYAYLLHPHFQHHTHPFRIPDTHIPSSSSLTQTSSLSIFSSSPTTYSAPAPPPSGPPYS